MSLLGLLQYHKQLKKLSVVFFHHEAVKRVRYQQWWPQVPFWTSWAPYEGVVHVRASDQHIIELDPLICHCWSWKQCRSGLAKKGNWIAYIFYNLFTCNECIVGDFTTFEYLVIVIRSQQHVHVLTIYRHPKHIVGVVVAIPQKLKKISVLHPTCEGYHSQLWKYTGPNFD